MKSIYIVIMVMIIYSLKFSEQNKPETLKEFLRSHGIYNDDNVDGYDKFGQNTWYPTLKLMKENAPIECGYNQDLYDRTVSFAVIMNRIYQFVTTTYNDRYTYVDVIMYDRLRERYSTKDKHLHLYDGFRVGVNHIIPETLTMGNFKRRLSDLFYGYPLERKKRLQLSLIWQKYKGFTYFSRLLLCCNRFWLVGEFPSTKDGYSIQENHYYDYHALRPTQSFHLVSLSLGNKALNIIHEDGGDAIKIIDFNITTHISSLCYGRHSTQLLRQISATDTCQYSQTFDTMTKSLIDLIQSFNYGFIIFTDLILVSREKNLLLIVDQNLFRTIDQEFPYKIKDVKDFFQCQRKN
ncbi:hypothetical protein BLA29_002060 [Euroglyphus maynei]|uniref:Uncharacterized protein n=1 Tax=Euroglyphus maynei TaxID=6958 RepID=A0A1Y3BC80_EURMA|nr:hypothetical protein BLA29_002060 [Euroglyphus maynei]